MMAVVLTPLFLPREHLSFVAAKTTAWLLKRYAQCGCPNSDQHIDSPSSEMINPLFVYA